jgi:hypothetical protein
MAGVACLDPSKGLAFSNRILRRIKSLRYFRHPQSAPVMNTMGR